MIRERVTWRGVVHVESGNQAGAGVFVGNTVVNRVIRKKRIARKIHLGDQASEQSIAEEREMYVRGAPGVMVIGPRIGAGLDGNETVAAVVVGEHAAATSEIGIERGVVLIVLVQIAARGVGLPDFDERVAHRAAVFVDDAAADDDAFSERMTGVLAGQIVVGVLDDRMAENRAGDFGKRTRHKNWRMRRRTFER